MELEPATLDPRRALQVTRYHTWPRNRDQSVGEHSMQVMRILLAIWPNCPRHMLVHCLKHDLGETVSGDPPYPIKALNPDLKQACDRIEGEAVKMMEAVWMVPHSAELAPLEYKVFKLAEFIEMWEWGRFELQMGNIHAELVCKRCSAAIVRHLEELLDADPRGRSRALAYLEQRKWRA
jgi:hypothetical protein